MAVLLEGQGLWAWFHIPWVPLQGLWVPSLSTVTCGHLLSVLIFPISFTWAGQLH